MPHDAVVVMRGVRGGKRTGNGSKQPWREGLKHRSLGTGHPRIWGILLEVGTVGSGVRRRHCITYLCTVQHQSSKRNALMPTSHLAHVNNATTRGVTLPGFDYFTHTIDDAYREITKVPDENGMEDAAATCLLLPSSYPISPMIR